MLDIKELRKNATEIERKLQNKVPETSLSPLLAKDEKIRQLKTEVEEYKSRRNSASKEIGLKKQKTRTSPNLWAIWRV